MTLLLRLICLNCQTHLTSPELNGTFNNWCGDCNPMSDANGDEIWEVTLSLNIGDTIEYKFSADNGLFKKHLILTKIVPMGFLILLIECLLSAHLMLFLMTFANRLENIGAYQVNIYPNPSSKEIFISSISNIKYLEIFNLMGQNKII